MIQIMNLIFVASQILFVVISVSSQSHLSPDTLKFYHDITAGRGLYAPEDKIKVLNNTNFYSTLYGKHKKVWVNEFYNSWCGHCHRFAPIWKDLAYDIHGWSSVIGLGAVDCSHNLNTPLCREYEIMAYPTVKYFPAGSNMSFLGRPVQIADVDQLRHNIIDLYKFLDAKYTVDERPYLLPFKQSHAKSVFLNQPPSVKLMLAVIEDDDSYIGAEIAFDLVVTPSVGVAIVKTSNHYFLESAQVKKVPSILVVTRDLKLDTIDLSQMNRTAIYNTLRSYLGHQHIDIPALLYRRNLLGVMPDVTHMMSVMQFENEIKNKLHMNQLHDIVFQVDLERAIRYSIFHEIPSKKEITGAHLDAVKAFIKILAKYFPIRKNGVAFLTELRDKIADRTSISGSEFERVATQVEDKLDEVFLPSTDWLGCKGSRIDLRGYPCALWMLFHTLTVQAAARPHISSPSEVLDAMANYIKLFFGCTDCSYHFQKMSVTIHNEVSSHDGAVLWLWRSHNKVNKRLRNDASADPSHPKIQFPSASSCPSCHLSEGEWNETEVFRFIKHMYQNISYIQVDELLPADSATPTPEHASKITKRHLEESKFHSLSQDIGPRDWDFNVFDVSLCVALYVASTAIVVLVCLKFVLKGSHRKGTFKSSFELFSKA